MFPERILESLSLDQLYNRFDIDKFESESFEFGLQHNIVQVRVLNSRPGFLKLAI